VARLADDCSFVTLHTHQQRVLGALRENGGEELPINAWLPLNSGWIHTHFPCLQLGYLVAPPWLPACLSLQ